ncbi:MAG: 5-deoxy-glucuronate isomerase [Christensenellaceae bacterium]|jgi:5-deoxy-glucuronate isomerase|nr:5-deoxy-glucuronate isomerase [Christensenellaceae bacterium]
MFIYPNFDATGKKTISKMTGKTSFALQDISIHHVRSGKTLCVYSPKMETAILLIKGAVSFSYDNKKTLAERKNMFSDSPVCLHIPRDMQVDISSSADSEILLQSTLNSNAFQYKLYTAENINSFISCSGKWENTAVRDVVTIFDYETAPYSNMVIGEVYARTGRWWSYIPHHHPQPEVYYYRFERPEGFGACFIGDVAHTIKDGSAGLFKGGYTHAQVTAPGYPMYCCWMIRHLDGNPWRNTRTDDPNYSWLLNLD